MMAIAPPALVLAALGVSELLTDRIATLQYLWWTPRIALVAVALLWLGIALAAAVLRRAAGDRRRLSWWLVATVLVGVAVLSRDWGLSSGRPADSFRLAHWNANWVHGADAIRAADELLDLEADAIVLTDPGTTLVGEGGRRLRAAGYETVVAGRFALCSRVPIREARPLLASRERFVSRLTLSTRFGPLVVEAVDLPSDAAAPRWLLARSLAADLEALRGAPPDVYVGDFNITRGSASLLQLAPDHRDAFREAGCGWGGTFRRDWPFLAIDLTLVAWPWRAERSETIDLGVGRHRAQATDLVREAGGEG